LASWREERGAGMGEVKKVTKGFMEVGPKYNSAMV
jgi:hypothetical protein